jgi:116 kDa U5 small nuclear ribonucleoprotein component
LTHGRFGNFIGEVEESEDDSQHGVDAGAYVYDEYPEEEAPETTGQELMEIDGSWSIERKINIGRD